MIKACKETGAFDAVVSKHWALGSKGATDLAKALVAACEKPSKFEFLYSLKLPIKEKIEIISKEMYGAKDVTYTDIALQKIKQYEEQVCVPYSLITFFDSYSGIPTTKSLLGCHLLSDGLLSVHLT